MRFCRSFAGQIPDVRFLIVGRNPGRKVEDLRRIDRVEVTGFVPDVRPWLAQASVAVAPLMIAAGVQNKILEAMASGLPVVATERAVQGLMRPIAEIVETAETPEALAARVVGLLRDPQRALRQGMEGRRRVAAAYRWDAASERLLQLIEDPSDAGSGAAPGTTDGSREVLTSA